MYDIHKYLIYHTIFNMNYIEVQQNAKKIMEPRCHVCKECNGVACRGELPGSGGKGSGNGFIRAYEKLSDIKVNMDTIYENKGQDTSFCLFGHTFSGPVFPAPVSGMSWNYTGYFTEETYSKALVEGTLAAGTIAFTGDGVDSSYYEGPLVSVKEAKGFGIPTIKPWDFDTIASKIKVAERINVFAIAMDIDSAGLPLITSAGNPLEIKSVEQLTKIRELIHIPFIIKGIMTVEGAKKAFKAGADAIIISNHGGRVLDCTPAPIEVLPEIRKAVGDSKVIFIDGAIRSGMDIFKSIAMGANAVLIGRPYVIAVHGGGAEGVEIFTKKYLAELSDVMKMTDCTTLSDIDFSKIYK